MEKLFRITINSIIRMPASAQVINGADDNGEMEHIIIDGRRLRPEVRWLEFHAKPPRELKKFTESLWISVAEEVAWRYLQPASEEWAMVEEPPPPRRKRRPVSPK